MPKQVLDAVAQRRGRRRAAGAGALHGQIDDAVLEAAERDVAAVIGHRRPHPRLDAESGQILDGPLDVSRTECRCIRGPTVGGRLPRDRWRRSGAARRQDQDDQAGCDRGSPLTTGGALSRVFDFQGHKFIASSCVVCGYTELSRRKSGMLGNAMFRLLSQDAGLEVFGTVRSAWVRRLFAPEAGRRLIAGVDVENQDALARIFADVKAQVVVNCIGLIKQLADADDPLQALPINAMLPHRLARLCELGGARLVHVSTDCVFAGTKGNYRESDPSDATDLYGKSKFLGEVAYPHTITLRTSIIGHELGSAHGLVGWFLAQEGQVRGYTRAIFSGLPTVELARVVRNVVLARPDLSGLYHVASSPIAKHDLLKLVAQVYGKAIEIVPDNAVVIDRSLNADRFREASGYVPPPWPELVKAMFEFK